MSHDIIAPDELVFEIDGVEPNEIDSLASLDFIRAMLRVVVSVGEVLDVDVAFSGVRIINKCTAFAFNAPDPAGTSVAVKRALFLVHNADARGEEYDAVRKALRALPPTYRTRVHVDGFSADVTTPLALAPTWTTSLEVFRATPQRAGGAKPAVRFRAPTEPRAFTLRATEALARELGGLLYTEVEIEAEVVRAADGTIEDGTLRSVTRLSDAPPLEAWTSWYESLGSPYSDVIDIEEALDRG